MTTSISKYQIFSGSQINELLCSVQWQYFFHLRNTLLQKSFLKSFVIRNSCYVLYLSIIYLSFEFELITSYIFIHSRITKSVFLFNLMIKNMALRNAASSTLDKIKLLIIDGKSICCFVYFFESFRDAYIMLFLGNTYLIIINTIEIVNSCSFGLKANLIYFCT